MINIILHIVLFATGVTYLIHSTVQDTYYLFLLLAMFTSNLIMRIAECIESLTNFLDAGTKIQTQEASND